MLRLAVPQALKPQLQLPYLAHRGAFLLSPRESHCCTNYQCSQTLHHFTDARACQNSRGERALHEESAQLRYCNTHRGESRGSFFYPIRAASCRPGFVIAHCWCERRTFQKRLHSRHHISSDKRSPIQSPGTTQSSSEVYPVNETHI